MTQTRANLLALGMILGIGFFFGTTRRAGHAWGDDFAMYIHHAKNIVEGHSYADTGLIRNPHNIIGPKAYLPLFPLMLAPIYRVSGIHLEAMKIEIIACFLIALYALYKKSFLDGLAPSYGLALILSVGLHPFFWLFKDNVNSDIPFLMFFYLAVWSYDKERCSWKTALAIVCACETREAGWVLVIGLFLSYLIRRQKPEPWAYVTLTAASGFAYLWRLYLSDSTYSGIFLFHRKLIVSQMNYYLWSLMSLWQHDYSSPLQWTLFGILAALAIWGIGQRWRKGLTLLEFSLIPYAGVLLTFTGTEYVRYLIPMIPAFLYYVFFGVLHGGPQRLRQGLLLFVMIFLAFTYGSAYRKLDFGPLTHGVTAPEALQLFQFVRDQTRESDVFVFEKPRALSLFTDRKASAYHSSSYKEFWAYANSIGATHLITHSNTGDSSRLFAASSPDQCRSIYKNAEFQIWKIRR